ncbi:glutathione S-transferase family protein [Paracoccus homiensis]|uniref:Glutathione S-transferase n=1 Tax=Paracoccus homiensis TaxID=364199 RepID=A0A1I0JAB8_9RHOB|nr:glutathione S-transferase [Paracoccus homiensis]SEU06830.1 glutathione S-transferase [Paracoccus homiensis]
MITLHALKYSRAARVLWLLADLDQPCNRVDYDRDQNFRAPECLRRIHPLGKSPVIEDDGHVIAESATILRYLVAKYGDHDHTPPVGTPAFWQHEALLDYAEASLAEVALQVILPAFQGKPASEPAQSALNRHLDYLSQEISDGPLLFGGRAMLADIQLSYIVALLARFDLLTDHPAIAAYWDRLQAQPGYIAAVQAHGLMAPPA